MSGSVIEVDVYKFNGSIVHFEVYVNISKVRRYAVKNHDVFFGFSHNIIYWNHTHLGYPLAIDLTDFDTISQNDDKQECWISTRLNHNCDNYVCDEGLQMSSYNSLTHSVILRNSHERDYVHKNITHEV